MNNNNNNNMNDCYMVKFSQDYIDVTEYMIQQKDKRTNKPKKNREWTRK